MMEFSSLSGLWEWCVISKYYIRHICALKGHDRKHGFHVFVKTLDSQVESVKPCRDQRLHTGLTLLLFVSVGFLTQNDEIIQNDCKWNRLVWSSSQDWDLFFCFLLLLKCQNLLSISIRKKCSLISYNNSISLKGFCCSIFCFSNTPKVLLDSSQSIHFARSGLASFYIFLLVK